MSNAVMVFIEGENNRAVGRILLEGESVGFGKQLEKAFPNATKGWLNEKEEKAIGDYLNILMKKSIGISFENNENFKKR